MQRFLFIVMLLIQQTLQAQWTDSMQVDIWGDRLICNKQTADDISDGDGRGDESFVQYFFGVVNMSDGSWRQRMVSANLDIKLLFTGGTYPLNKPLFTGYSLKDDEILVVVPVAWEQDVNSNVVAGFRTLMLSCLDIIGPQLATRYDVVRQRSVAANGYYQGIFVDGGNLGQLNWGSFTGLPSFKTLLEPVRGGAGTRPVGMNKDGEFTPAFFSFSKIQLLTKTASDKQGTVLREFLMNADYNEDALGNTANHGNYTVSIHVLRRNNTTPNPQPAPMNPVIQMPVKNPDRPVSIINPGLPQRLPPRPVFSITGVWKGQWTADGYPLKIKLDDAGFLEVYNINDAVAARGTYTFTNDILDAKFTLNGRNYMLTGTANKAANSLSGTWRQTNSITNENGTWSMTK